jgi:hypothetical protein
MSDRYCPINNPRTRADRNIGNRFCPTCGARSNEQCRMGEPEGTELDRLRAENAKLRAALAAAEEPAR